MKASKYIKELKRLIDDYGDLEVCVQVLNDETGIWDKIPSQPIFIQTLSGIYFVGILEEE